MNALTILLLLSVTASYLGFAAGQCDVCLKNNVSCVNETSYVLCGENSDGTTDDIKHCDEGFLCTDRPEICSPKSKDIEAAACTARYLEIESCEACTVAWEKDFACVSENEYVPCNQLGIPIMDEKVECDGDLICSMRFEEKCVAKSRFEPSCVDDMNPSSTTVNTLITETPNTVFTEQLTTDVSVSTTTTDETQATTVTSTTLDSIGSTSEEPVRSCYKCTKKWSKNFACLSENLYVFCDQSGRPLISKILECDKKSICNVGSKDVCVSKTVHKPSCYTNTPTDDPDLDPVSTTTLDSSSTMTETVTTVVTSRPLNPDEQCADLETLGMHRIDCFSYLLCSMNNRGGLESKEMTCPPSTYFNPETKICDTVRPDGCPEAADPNTSTIDPLLQMCDDMGGHGKYPIDCRQYLTCTNVNGVMHPKVSTCGIAYYHPNLFRCFMSQPKGC